MTEEYAEKVHEALYDYRRSQYELGEWEEAKNRVAQNTSTIFALTDEIHRLQEIIDLDALRNLILEAVDKEIVMKKNEYEKYKRALEKL